MAGEDFSALFWGLSLLIAAAGGWVVAVSARQVHEGLQRKEGIDEPVLRFLSWPTRIFH